jgi:hypothetical protein
MHRLYVVHAINNILLILVSLNIIFLIHTLWYVRNIKLNEIAYTELILSIDVKASHGKIVFDIVKGCKCKDNSDRNEVTI